MKYLCVILLCIVSRTIANFEQFDSEVQLACASKCSITPKSTETAHYDYACDYNCNVEQCKKGCSLWNIALNSTCQRACNGESDRLTQKSHHCVMGCNDAISKYYLQLKKAFGLPPAPALVADTLRSTSLKLEWHFPLTLKKGLSCYVQWKYDDDLVDQWQYCKNVTWESQDSIVFVQNLHPYTKYRFRIAIALQGYLDQYRIFSIPSVVISTAPSGVPASPPNIDVAPDIQYYMFHNLRAETNYNISIRMRNREGSGPPVDVVVKTLKERMVRNIQQPELILGTENSVIQLEATIIDEPEILYVDHYNKFLGMAIHIQKKLLFISDTSGRIVRLSLERNQTQRNQRAEVILEANRNFQPLDLTVDWLNDQLYILTRMSTNMYQVVRCSLEGKGLTVALAGLYLKPAFMEVDPCNGYLFWIIQNESKGGLYRLDLADISNGIKHEIQPKRILNNSSLGAFIVDYTNFHILVPYQSQNTIYSVSLDGKELTNFRSKVTKARLQKVISLAYANKKFYWTDSKEIFYEEYHQKHDSYFHNSWSVGFSGYKKVFVDVPTSQPIPVPINPPTNMQAIFGCTIANTKWQPPYPLGVQSFRGAWQNWSYEIHVTEVQTNKVFTIKNINTTFYTIQNLKENTEYILKTVAYTSSGRSPWSSEFRGVTLSESKQSLILWSAGEGLLRSNAAGEEVETLIPKSKLKNFNFIDIAWYKEKIYLVTNTSEVLWLNTTSYEQGSLSNMDSIRSIAVDWIGKKIYWSNPIMQVISRVNFDGGQKEHLPIYVMGKELNIDPIKAYLYWSTGFAVECSRLNGGPTLKYQETQFFQDTLVLGLTLNMDNKNVYWIMRGPDGSNLYRAPMAGYVPDEDIKPMLVYKFNKPYSMHGPLYYFHKRLLWLQEDKNGAVISDLIGNNVATINGNSFGDLSTVCVIDSSLHNLPDNITEEIIVIPEPVDKNSIKTIGTSSCFNVTWNPIENVNYGTVFYEVTLVRYTASNNYSSKITTETSIIYWQNVEPHVRINISIRAYTYWGSAQQVWVQLYSPSSTPTAPINLRTYVIYEDQHNNSQDQENHVSITFRWDSPLKPNGEIIGYKVYCWYFENDQEINLCKNITVKGKEKEYILNGLMENEIYYLQVQAFTDKGDGFLSEIMAVNSSHKWPLPCLLIASSDSIFIDDMDINHRQSIIHGINTPIEIAYLLKEQKIFWVNQMNELRMYDLRTNKTKTFDIKQMANGVTVDWLERSLYYVESDQNTTLYKIDLNHLDKNIKESYPIYTTNSKISKIEISPFTRKLYWVETSDGSNFKLMKSNTDGSDAKPFFEPHHIERRSLNNEQCNCQISNIEPTFTIDHSDVNKKPVLIFIDNNKNVVATDKDGCICNTIANQSIVNNYPLDKIKADFGTLYWTNPTKNILYSLKKSDSNIQVKNVNAHDILIYGQHMQPYPKRECLAPKQQHNFTAKLVRRTYDSLLIEMPKFDVHSDCSGISMAKVEYKIYFAKYNESTPFCTSNICQTEVTDNQLYELTDLKPFTEYIVSVAVSNHFTRAEEVVMGPPVIFKTGPGAPSKPQNVSAIVLNPTLAEVNWLPSEELHGLRVYYEIHWQTEGALSGVRQKGEQPVQELHNKNNTKILTTLLEKLSPNSTYIIWVKAYSETNETSSDSDRVQIITYAKPTDLVLVNKTAYSLKLSWKKSLNMRDYRVQFAPIISNEWQVAFMDKQTGHIIVENLKPKMQYKFRLSILYNKYPEWYQWPTDSRFTFETLGDKPSPPGTPNFQYVKTNVYKVAWEAAKENGAPIEMYNLEGMKLKVYRTKRSTNRPPWFNTAPAVEEEERIWESFYNGTNTSWIIEGLSDKHKYSFRVAALNAYGWSLPSKESSEFDLNEAARYTEKQDPGNLILIAIAIPLLIGLCVALSILYTYLSKCGKPKKVAQVVAVPRGPDVELATLRELPRRGIHSTNILYVSTQQPTPEEITLLPHIRRDQITLTKFLGSGAFGEVYEGKAKGICGSTRDTKVAVKTLRKGASDPEKTEFLQEAELMSHFKHEHILQLLGVCLDNDPHFIIMELMLGGDLLTYLRSSRNSTSTTPSLTLIELLKMCVDVSKGCRYLEEMHFVHRDLACRNCLVSSTDKESRIVKIGDFGLARDIYKNDYYRKEGEGLLPVRWMAPESLVDGVFTSQSDVWAFGVLLWEIMTVGQQPYPARSNLEVLHYVRRGGRLGKPTDCPEDLHNLMLKCWEFVPEKRPTFKYCLEVLVNLHQENLRNPVTGAHQGQYISTVPDPGNFWLNENEDDANKEKTPFLSSTEPGEIPKYLELIYERQSPLENDGYEVPTQIIKASENEESPNSSSLISTTTSDNQGIGDQSTPPNGNIEKVLYNNLENTAF